VNISLDLLLTVNNCQPLKSGGYSELGNDMGLQTLWVTGTGTGVGMDLPTCELQNEPKIIQMVQYWVCYDYNHELGLF